MDSKHIDLLGNEPLSSSPEAQPPQAPKGERRSWWEKMKQGLSGKRSNASQSSIVAMRSLNVGPRPEQSGGFDVNLIPELEAQKMTRHHLRVLGSGVLITIGVLLIIEMLLWLQRSTSRGNLQDLQQQLRMVEQSITELVPIQKEATAVRERVERANYVADRHVLWTQLLSEIEATTLPAVTYSSFVADQAGTITMAATADQFKTVGDQMNVFKAHPGFSEVQVTGVTIKGGTEEAATPENAAFATGVEFSISLKFDPALLTSASARPSQQQNGE